MPPTVFCTSETTSVSPSMSVSLARTVAVTSAAWSSVRSSVSSFATGASFTHRTLTVTCPVSVPPWPSLIT